MSTTATITRPPTPVPSTIVLTVAANIGTQLQLAYVVKDAGANVLNGQPVTWTSATPAVATVDSNGLVTPLTVGSSVITAHCGSATDTCTVTVA